MQNYHVQLYQYNGPVLKNERTQYINKLPQWNQLIFGSNYIYYVVKYTLKNVMEIFFHSVGSFSSIFFPALKSAVRSRTPLLTKVSSVATYFLVAAGRERQEG